MQAVEGACRDELTLKPEALAEMKESKDLFTERVANKSFETIFERKFGAEWSFNPNMRQFKRKINPTAGAAQSTDSENGKPILFLYYPAKYMAHMSDEFSSVLRNYGEAFDVYYCEEE